jgi:Asp-tRNA(Asn)/Glu-tRNA(Gln) amidotransferase A subunit family amidase
LDLKDESYVPRNKQDRFHWELYEKDRYVEAPVGLQIVTRRFENEKYLAVLEVMERAMGHQ